MEVGRMEENKNLSLAEKIEKLILDNNKQVLSRLDRLEEGQGGLMEGQRELMEGQRELKNGQKRLEAKVDAVHPSLKKEITATAYAIKDDIKDKVDEHLRLAHAGAMRSS